MRVLPRGLILVSRFFDKKSMLHQEKKLTTMLQTLFGKLDSGVQSPGISLTLALIGGGEVLKSQPHTSVHPAWRKTYMIAEQVEFAPPESGMERLRQVWGRATNKKFKAMKNVTPDMGTYLNEADPYDPDWKEAWYGDKSDDLKLQRISMTPKISSGVGDAGDRTAGMKSRVPATTDHCARINDSVVGEVTGFRGAFIVGLGFE